MPSLWCLDLEKFVLSSLSQLTLSFAVVGNRATRKSTRPTKGPAG